METEVEGGGHHLLIPMVLSSRASERTTQQALRRTDRAAGAPSVGRAARGPPPPAVASDPGACGPTTGQVSPPSPLRRSKFGTIPHWLGHQPWVGRWVVKAVPKKGASQVVHAHAGSSVAQTLLVNHTPECRAPRPRSPPWRRWRSRASLASTSRAPSSLRMIGWRARLPGLLACLRSSSSAW